MESQKRQTATSALLDNKGGGKWKQTNEAKRKIMLTSKRKKKKNIVHANEGGAYGPMIVCGNRLFHVKPEPKRGD